MRGWQNVSSCSTVRLTETGKVAVSWSGMISAICLDIMSGQFVSALNIHADFDRTLSDVRLLLCAVV